MKERFERADGQRLLIDVLKTQQMIAGNATLAEELAGLVEVMEVQANYAAKLCSYNGKHSTYITKAVFDSMDKSAKFGGKDNVLMCDEKVWAGETT